MKTFLFLVLFASSAVSFAEEKKAECLVSTTANWRVEDDKTKLCMLNPSGESFCVELTDEEVLRIRLQRTEKKSL